MDYFDAFGGLIPHKDKDGAIKFCLNAILLDDDIDQLSDLLARDSKTVGIEGQPNWIITRRKQNAKMGSLSNWPKDAQFRAYVDPEGYSLAFPEGFYDRPAFQRFVSVAMNAYKARHPDRTRSANQVLSLISSA